MFYISGIGREHLSDVAEIERLCFSDPWSEESLELLVSTRATGLVATENGRVLGYVGMMCVLDEGQIINLAVHPDARRRGIGRALIEKLEELAKERGLVYLALEVRESNDAARSLYVLMGWNECGIRRNFYSHPTENAIVMTKELSDAR